MNVIDKELLEGTLKNIDKKIDRLNNQKITAFFESLALDKRNDISKDYLNWENILIVVPSRSTLNEVIKYKDLISRISFITNPNAVEIHIYDFNDWKKAPRIKQNFKLGNC